MVEASEFVDGADVDWTRLARTLIGGAFGALFTGIASVVLGISDLPIAVLEWLAEFNRRVVELVAGIPARMIAPTWGGVADFIDGSGPLAFLLGLAFVLLTLYIAVRIARYG